MLNHDKLQIGLPTYPFPLFFEEWGLEKKDVTKAWNLEDDIYQEIN